MYLNADTVHHRWEKSVLSSLLLLADQGEAIFVTCHSLNCLNTSNKKLTVSCYNSVGIASLMLDWQSSSLSKLVEWHCIVVKQIWPSYSGMDVFYSPVVRKGFSWISCLVSGCQEEWVSKVSKGSSVLKTESLKPISSVCLKKEKNISYSYGLLRGLLQCHSGTQNNFGFPIYLLTFVAQLWSLSLLDSIRYGFERKWPMQSFKKGLPLETLKPWPNWLSCLSISDNNLKTVCHGAQGFCLPILISH